MLGLPTVGGDASLHRLVERRVEVGHFSCPALFLGWLSSSSRVGL